MVEKALSFAGWGFSHAHTWREGRGVMGGWRHDSRKKSTQIYEMVMGVLMACVLVYVLIEWAIGVMAKGTGN